jgi:protein TonB
MSYALSRPSQTRRSGLLTVVIGLHIGIFLIILAVKTVVPQIMEMPLVVDLLQAEAEPKPPEAKPLPVSKPQPVKPQPKTKAPLLEATNSTAPAPAAPVAAQTETKQAPATPASEPVSLARFDAEYLRNPPPTYPPLSRRMGEEGKVILRVSVNAQGGADSVEVKTSSGSPRLDDAAVHTIKKWKFISAKRGDTPVQSWVLVPIIFKLEQ